MEQVLVGSAMLALVPVFWLLMWRGWRRRERAQVDVPAPREPGALPGGAAGAAGRAGGASRWLEEPVEAVYVSTTLAGQPYERVTAHGLGTRSSALVGTTGAAPAASWVVLRRGARSFEVPAGDVVGVDRRRGMAGKFMFEKEGLVVVTWRSGEVQLDTGLRCATRAGADRLVAEVSALVEASRGPLGGPLADGPTADGAA